MLMTALAAANRTSCAKHNIHTVSLQGLSGSALFKRTFLTAGESLAVEDSVSAPMMHPANNRRFSFPSLRAVQAAKYTAVQLSARVQRGVAVKKVQGLTD